MITDLPGIYNLTAQSEDERIAKDFLLEERIDLAIQVIDSTHIERHLFLTSQLMEMGLPLMVALNMWDLVKKRGLEIDLERLKLLLEIEIIPTAAEAKEGLFDLLDVAIDIIEKKKSSFGVRFPFSRQMEIGLLKIQKLLSQELPSLGQNDLRFFALRLLEEDPSIEKKCSSHLMEGVKKTVDSLKENNPRSVEMQISMARHEEIKKNADLCIKKEAHLCQSISDHMDKVLLYRAWGLPIFFPLHFLDLSAHLFLKNLFKT